MAELKEKLIELADDVLRYLPWGEISSHTAEDIANHLIANGVTVPVRCKDCKQWNRYQSGSIFGEGHGNCVNCFMVTQEEHFCAFGERRTDG